jgi:quinol-cytochrome oxidoreductase complex cytochrome b subunit
MSKPGIGQLIAGAGGVLLIVSLFLPWADVQGVSQSGWEFSTTTDVFLLIAGLVAIGAAITGGQLGFFRPDLSLNGATDLLGIVSTLLLAWLLFFDFPSGADQEIGAFLALIAAIAIMGGAGDYSVLRRGPRADGHQSPHGG